MFAEVLKEAQLHMTEKINFKLSSTWKSHEFTNLCERAVKNGDLAEIAFCEKVINNEWQLLFDHCIRLLEAIS